MAEKMCNTINQNIDPYTGKLIINYFKQFGTLLNHNINTSDRNDLSQITINHSVTQDDTNISMPDYSDPDTEFHEIIEEAYVDPNLVWDRGKISNQPSGTPDDLVYLRRLECSVINLESYLESMPSLDSTPSQNSRRVTLVCPSPPLDDTLSDVDLDKFDTNRTSSNGNQSVSANRAMADKAETASLSDFHNVRDVLLNIQERLESYLKVNHDGANDPENPSSGSNLEGNIAVLKGELERYVNVINEKKENELRKFSENMINRSNIVQMKKAFLRKEKLQTNIYETLTSKYAKYAIANKESLPPTLHFKDRVHTQGGFTMRNCYDNDYVFETYSDFSSVEYYTMLINEEKSERLLNDAPQPRYHDREKISLIFRDPENVIKQWQNYQLKTIHIKPKKVKSLKLKWQKGFKHKQPDEAWGFTMDYHQNRVLQRKLERERRIRLIFRIFFYFLSVVFFVLIVYLTQSIFTLNKRDTIE